MPGQITPRLKSLVIRMCLMAALAMPCAALAAEYHGLVSYGGLPVPGVTVTVTQDGKKFVTVTDTQGSLLFSDAGGWCGSVAVEMTGFSAVRQDVVIATDATASGS